MREPKVCYAWLKPGGIDEETVLSVLLVEANSKILDVLNRRRRAIGREESTLRRHTRFRHLLTAIV